MKKFLFIIILFLITAFTQNAFAEDIYNITAANFDTSNSLIVFNIQDESEQPVLNDIKLVNLDNPKRVYFDIPSSILKIPKQDWTFNTKGIRQIKINQFSTNPNTVRVVMYTDDDFNVQNLKFLRLKNNIIIKLKTLTLEEQYFQNTYRDEHSSSSDFYEYMTVEVPDESRQQEAGLIKKDLKLNTKYYISKITARQNSVLLSGFGAVTVEKPLVLQNPSRVIYDIPNTFVDKEIRNTEYKLNETDSVKIGQFEANKARIVITTPDTSKYIPVYSADNQSLLIIHLDKINPNSLFSETTDIISYNVEKTSAQTSSMILSFNRPVVHAIDRLNSKLIIYLFNASRYNDDNFKSVYKNTAFANSDIALLQNTGMKLTIPVESDAIVNTYLGANGKILKIQTTTPKKTKPPATATNTNKSKKVVIDPGHGGSDVGAIRGDITEKAITLDVSKRVRDILVKQGYKVEMTRDIDKTVSLQERVDFSEERKPDIFISIHVNSSERPEITGIETHYYRQDSLSLAQTVHAAMASNINSKNRGLFKSKFYVINHTTSPAILVEIGFISNAGERAELISEKRKQATAKAIAEGVQNYFKNK